jgi:predicted extracellular nuclease
VRTRTLLAAAGTLVVGSVVLTTPPTGAAAEAADGSVVLNEVLASTAGTDSEYVELHGPPGASLAGLSIISVESDDQASNGQIEFRVDLGDDARIGDNGFFLAANETAQATYGVAADRSFSASLENSSATHALVETASLTGGTVDDGIVVLDAVGSSDGEDASFFAFGVPVVGPDGTFLPAGVGRIADGVDTDTADDWRILSFDNDPSINTPTAGGTSDGGGDEAEARYVHEVQGSGAESPLSGDRVVVEGVVVGDEEGPSPRLGGFFVQEEDTDADTDPATSEGVFVYTAGADRAAVGDLVRVTGTVQEFNGNTQLGEAYVEVLGAAPAPTPATVTFPLGALEDLEAVEGMAATFPQQLTVTEYFDYDRYGEVVVALPYAGEDRPYTPTAVAEPGSTEAIARRDWNTLSRITVDDGLSSQNPDTVVHPFNREPFTLTNRFRGGDRVSGLTGPVYYSFGMHRLLPTGLSAYDVDERPATPEDVGGDVRVAAMNTLNYFTTLDDGRPHCGPDGTMECRGADDAAELERQRAKLLSALAGMDADVIALNELENTRGVEVLADLAQGLRDRTGADWTHVAVGTDGVVGTDAIKVGVLYRSDRVTPVGVPAVLDTPAFLDPAGTGQDKNRAAVAASFVQNGTDEVFSVAVNHLKSKGSGCGAGDDDEWAGSCNRTRTLAARELARWIDGNPTQIRDDDWMVLGDLNSYDHEDPIDALRAAGYTDLVREHVGELGFSYVFDGQWGYLDHALASPSLTEQVAGLTEWHINASEPDLLDYDTSFKSPAQDALFDPTTPYRSSDHDPVLVGLALDDGNEGLGWDLAPGRPWR